MRNGANSFSASLSDSLFDAVFVYLGIPLSAVFISVHPWLNGFPLHGYGLAGMPLVFWVLVRKRRKDEPLRGRAHVLRGALGRNERGSIKPGSAADPNRNFNGTAAQDDVCHFGPGCGRTQLFSGFDPIIVSGGALDQ